jgi:hypothetical protein
MAAAGVRFCGRRQMMRTEFPIPIVREDDPYAEIDAMAADVFRAVAIGVVILSIARPLLKLAGIVVICVLVLLFV